MNKIKHSLLYLIAAGLFAVATALNFYNDGFNLMTVLGSVFVAVMLAQGLKVRRAGR